MSLAGRGGDAFLCNPAEHVVRVERVLSSVTKSRLPRRRSLERLVVVVQHLRDLVAERGPALGGPPLGRRAVLLVDGVREDHLLASTRYPGAAALLRPTHTNITTIGKTSHEQGEPRKSRLDSERKNIKVP